MSERMSEHLTPELISELLDEPQAAPEGIAHLEACEACRREYEQMSRMRMALSGIGGLEPPAGEWARISERLDGAAGAPDRAGPPGGASGGGATFGRRAWLRATWLQAAAVLALFAGGLLVGRAVRSPEAGEPARIAGAGGEEAGIAVPPGGGIGIGTGAASPLSGPEAAYLRAVADLAGLRAAGGEAADPAAATEQLARLDAVQDALSEALTRSPADPVLNNLLFEVADERASLSRQLSETLQLANLEYR